MTNINYDFIESLEGFETKGYVPDPKGSNSGVTIGSGVDLGARNINDLNKLGVFMTMESARNYVSSDDISTHIIIDKEKYYEEEKIVEDLNNVLSDNYEVMTWKETLPEIEQTITADSAGGLIMAFILYVIVVFGMLYLSIKYRHKKGEDLKLTSSKDHSTLLESLFFIIPLILVSITFVWGIKSYLQMVIVPDDAIEIKVTGQSWFWTFDYPDGGTTLNELVVPSNKPVKLVLSSKDVLHSFFIPVMRSKMDCLPNRYNVMWFDSTKEGVYDIFCTEYCGTGHSNMGAKVIVMKAAQYEEWASELGSEDDDLPLDELGAKLYTKKACNTCHTLDGSALVGPSYLQTSQMWGQERVFDDGSSSVIDDNYVRSSILEPMTQIVAGYQGVMPTYQGLLSDRELDALIAFLKTLNEDSQI